MKKNIIGSLVLILCLLLASPCLSISSNFIRVTFGAGGSIEVPKNWIAYSNSQRITLDSFVEAKVYRQVESRLPFAANLYDERGKTDALINVRFYPNNTLTQLDAQQFTLQELKQLSNVGRGYVDKAMIKNGVKLTKWFNFEKKTINGIYVLYQKSQYENHNTGTTMNVVNLRVWNSPNTYTVTINYNKDKELLLRPIVNRMINTLR